MAALFGHLLVRPVVLRPRFPEGEGQDERTVGYLETSFLPLRQFSSLADLQSQHDDWSRDVAFERHHRRVGAKVKEAWAVERGYLRALPDPLPDIDWHSEVRVMKDGSAWAFMLRTLKTGERCARSVTIPWFTLFFPDN